MKRIKTYFSESYIPTPDELEQAQKIASADEEDCIVEIRYKPTEYSPSYSVFINKFSIIKDVYESIPKKYGV